MNTIDFSQPFPDYVTCPQCGEPEVEVWCYAEQATCHKCGTTFDHSLPPECQPTCSVNVRAQAAQIALHHVRGKTCSDVIDPLGARA
jgi:hypothetical protein